MRFITHNTPDSSCTGTKTVTDKDMASVHTYMNTERLFWCDFCSEAKLRRVDLKLERDIWDRFEEQGTRTWNHWDGTDIQSFSVFQGRSFGSGKLAVVDVFKNGQESLWDATLNKPLPQLIRILISDWAQKIYFLCPIGGQRLSRCFRDLLIRSLLFSRKWCQ